MSGAPLVGIVACRKEISPHWFHVAGEKYVSAVVSGAGSVPLLLPPLGSAAALDRMLDVVHGIFLTGSPSNVEPHHYGGAQSEAGTLHDSQRDATTLPLIRRAVDLGMPLFAVCRGFQEVNVAMGGTLHAKIQEQPGMMDHREDPAQPVANQYAPAHSLSLAPGSTLEKLAGTSEVMVNSLHSQGVERLAPGLDVLATAPDGLIEAFCLRDAAQFTLAVQWHPEWQVQDNPFSLAMFRAFGDACRLYAQSGRSNRGASL